MFNFTVADHDRIGHNTWEGCAQFQMLIIIVLGGVMPLLVSSTLEEKAREDWLWRQPGPLHGTPIVNSMLTRVVYDLVFLAMGAVMAYQCIELCFIFYHIFLPSTATTAAFSIHNLVGGVGGGS